MEPSLQNLLSIGDKPPWNVSHGYRWLGGATIAGLGLLSFAVHASYVFRTRPPLVAFLVGSAVPVLLSLIILGSALWLLSSQYSRFAPRTALWCLGGTLVLIAIGQLFLLYQRTIGAPSETPWFVLIYLGTNGTVIGLFVGMYDASLQQTTEELDSQRERAEDLSERLSVLNRFLRHDLRSGVQSIQGYAGMLPDPPDMDPTIPIERIQEEAAEMHETAEYARTAQKMIEKGRQQTERVEITDPLADAVDTVTDEYPDADIQTEMPDSAFVTGSPIVGFVFEELLTNAVEHNDSNPCEVVVVCEVTSDAVTVRISDNGPGIPESEVEPLRSGEETALVHTTGFGLWVSKWIVEGAGGSLEFETAENGGTTVIVRHPR